MLTNQALCLRIRELYPDIGACGIDVKVAHDDQEDRWVVYLNGGYQYTGAFPGNAAEYIGNQCVCPASFESGGHSPHARQWLWPHC